jgi:DNA-binding response OmpR family regulator
MCLVKTILVVDDDPAVLQCLASILERFNYGVKRAETAKDALNIAADGIAFDLAIVDVQLPGMSGLELVRALKHKRPTLPVIVLTGNGSLETYCAASTLGVDKYVLKPIRARELGQLVAEMLMEAPPVSTLTEATDYDFMLKQLNSASRQ